MKIYENKKKKIVKSEKYNSVFDKTTGFFARWGETEDDNPICAPMPEIADIEISSGMCHNNCPFCYKGNKKDGKLHNMTFEQFRNIFHKIARTVWEVKFEDDKTDSPFSYRGFINAKDFPNAFTKMDMVKEIISGFYKPDNVKSLKIYNAGLLQQIAFGITSPTDNPVFFRMMEYCKEFDIIPNYTCNGTDMTEEIAKKSVDLCGAIALSVNDKEATYNAVKIMSDVGIKQINLHCVTFDGSYDKILGIIDDITTDERLKELNALVCLRYKPKGTNAGKFKQLTQEQYNKIFKYAEEKGVRLGFDSCSCHSYLNAIKGDKRFSELSKCAEPCESTLFSIYVNSYCEVSPCSFCENEIRENGENWTKGINLLEIQDFQREVWNSDKIKHFRELLLKNNRKCPMWNLD